MGFTFYSALLSKLDASLDAYWSSAASGMAQWAGHTAGQQVVFPHCAPPPCAVLSTVSRAMSPFASKKHKNTARVIMEFFSILSFLIGAIGAWYLGRSSEKYITKEASREASHIRTLEGIEYELKKLDEVAKRDGFLSKKNGAFMSALYSRWFDLKKQSNGT